MSITERILLYFSKETDQEIADSAKSDWSFGSALSLLESSFPHFDDLVAGKRVVDFGCGGGYQSVALSEKYGSFVLGLDANSKSLAIARDNAKTFGVCPSKLRFESKVCDTLAGSFDVVISQNSFEHFNEPEAILVQMKKLTNEGGKVLITFGPPWFSPYGAHMSFFCKVPWVHVLFSEKAVMRARSHFRNDGAMKYEEVESGLNKMSIAKFERIIESSGLQIDYKDYRCLKGIDVLSRLPGVREFFINQVSVVLSKRV